VTTQTASGWTGRSFAALVLMALAYAVVARLALLMAVPPAYASPMFPAAGMALVFVLVYGQRAALAVVAGALIVNVLMNPLRGAGIAEAAIALGAGLQALAAAALVRRQVTQPLTLSAPLDIARFYVFGAAVGCLVNASVATAALGLAGVVPHHSLPMTWLTWWIGDALGTLIGAPLLLTLIGRPREAWAPRRRTVGATLAIVTTLLVATTMQVARWDDERVQISFARDAEAASTALASQLNTPLHALEAMRGLFVGSAEVSAAELHMAADHWLGLSSNLQAVGHLERVQLADVPAFEARMRAQGSADYRVMDRTASNDRVPTRSAEVFAARLVEPVEGNQLLLGVNALSIPASRAAIDAAVRTDRPVATAAFQLSQDPVDTPKRGVVVYRALYQGHPSTEAERVAAVRGVVFVTVRVEDLLREVLAHAPAHLNFCVTDTDPSVEVRHLAVSALCADGPDRLTHRRMLDFAGRHWELQVASSVASADTSAGERHYAWLFSSVGLLTTAVLGALLLTVTGRARLIEIAVQERTVALEQQVRERLEAVRAREAAEASNRAKSDFLSRMSHELRTPLNAMLGFAQLLELESREPLGPTQRGWVGQIRQAGWHLLEMINDVLDLSRIESGNLRMALETLNMPELLASTRPLVQQAADRRGITIEEHLSANASHARGDATRVKQILTNLLSNAVKYNVDGGHIRVSSQVRGDRVEVMVADTGLGMNTQQMTALFQPFNRLGQELSSTEGTGIGLVISQRLAELMGGDLSAASDVGQGSLFILSLPLASPEEAAAQTPMSAAGISDYHHRRVHYIEDNETNVEVMRGMLAQRPQVDLRVSGNGLDGLTAIRARRPDVLLLDMHLPDISGLELLRHLKLDPETRGIPVIVVSADALPTQIAEALQAGAHRYLTKPVSVGELLEVLDELLAVMETRFDDLAAGSDA
jgi:signal transduction histidine kinase/CheY-like chemotaxis protein